MRPSTAALISVPMSSPRCTAPQHPFVASHIDSAQQLLEKMPPRYEGKKLIALVQMGSGKTGAFTLPILQELLQNRDVQHSFFACIQ